MLSAEERDFPFTGGHRFLDAESGGERRVEAAAVREEFLERFALRARIWRDVSPSAASATRNISSITRRIRRCSTSSASSASASARMSFALLAPLGLAALVALGVPLADPSGAADRVAHDRVRRAALDFRAHPSAPSPPLRATVAAAAASCVARAARAVACASGHQGTDGREARVGRRRARTRSRRGARGSFDPGARTGAGSRRDFPRSKHRPTSAPLPIASLLRELDADLPRDTTLAVVVPDAARRSRRRTADACRVRSIGMSCRPDGRANRRARTNGDDRLAVRYAPSAEARVAYLRAAVTALNAREPVTSTLDARAQDVAPGRRIAMSSSGLAPRRRRRSRHGSKPAALRSSMTQPGATGAPVWRDADGNVLARVQPLGRGRLVALAAALTPHDVSGAARRGFSAAPARSCCKVRRRHRRARRPMRCGRRRRRGCIARGDARIRRNRSIRGSLLLIARADAHRAHRRERSAERHMSIDRAPARARPQRAIASRRNRDAVRRADRRCSSSRVRRALRRAWLHSSFAAIAGVALVLLRTPRDAFDRRGMDRAPARCRTAARRQRGSVVPRSRPTVAVAAVAARSRLQRRLEADPPADIAPQWPWRTLEFRLGSGSACDRARGIRAARSFEPIGFTDRRRGRERARDGDRSRASRRRGAGLHADRRAPSRDARNARSRRFAHRVAVALRDRSPRPQRLNFHDGSRVDLKRDGDDWTGARTLTASALYRIALDGAPPLGGRSPAIGSTSSPISAPDVRVIQPEKSLTLLTMVSTIGISLSKRATITASPRRVSRSRSRKATARTSRSRSRRSRLSRLPPRSPSPHRPLRRRSPLSRFAGEG